MSFNVSGSEPHGQAYQHPFHHEVDGQHSISTVKENKGGLYVAGY